jgi:outer membrane protein assembly factor BamB
MVATPQASSNSSTVSARLAARALPWIRWPLASVISALTPLITISVAVYLLVLGRLPVKSAAVLLFAVLGVALLTRRWGPADGASRGRFLSAGAALLASLLVNGIVAARYFGGPVHSGLVVMLWCLSTLWVVSMSWLWGLPLPRRVRLGMLGATIPLATVFPTLFHVGQLQGDGRLLVQWRWNYQPATPPVAQIASSGASAKSLTGTDYPGFLGRERSPVVHGWRLEKDWRANPPTLVWRQPVGAAWSSVAVSDPLAITQAQEGREETVVAFDCWTGERRWRHADESYFDGNGAGGGPRATPSIDGGQVFTIGASGILNCLDLDTGRRIWSRNILVDVNGSRPEHGVTGSPLVVGDLVVAVPGTSGGPSLAAYRRTDGKLIWTAGSRAPSYSSPMLRRSNGVAKVVLLDSGGLIFHDASDGRLLGSVDWGGNFGNRCCQPVFASNVDDRVIYLSSYECGGTTRLTIDDASPPEAWRARTDWKSPVLKSKFTTPVLWNGCLMGIDQGLLVCLDAASGKRLWKGGRYGESQLLLVDDLLLVLSENGQLILVEPSRNQLVELARIDVLHGKTWNAPALAHGRLYVRNAEEAACYALPGKMATETAAR